MKFSEIQPKSIQSSIKCVIKEELIHFAEIIRNKTKLIKATSNQGNPKIFAYDDMLTEKENRDCIDVLFLVLDLGNKNFWIYRQFYNTTLFLVEEHSPAYKRVLGKHRTSIQGRAYNLSGYTYGEDLFEE